MSELSLKFVYQNLSIDEKQNVINLWTQADVLTTEEAKDRLNEVSLLILDKEKIVGVSTVYINDFISPNNRYFFFRMFIKEDHRGSNKLRTQVMQKNFQELKKHYDKQINGLVVELENEKLASLGEKSNYFSKRGYTYYGKSVRGLQLWYVRFDDPKGIFTQQLIA